MEGFVPCGQPDPLRRAFDRRRASVRDPVSGKSWNLGDSLMITIVRADVNLGKGGLRAGPSQRINRACMALCLPRLSGRAGRFFLFGTGRGKSLAGFGDTAKMFSYFGRKYRFFDGLGLVLGPRLCYCYSSGTAGIFYSPAAQS